MTVNSLREEVFAVANADGGGGLHRNEAMFRALSGVVVEAGFLTNPQFAPVRFKMGRQQCAIDGYDIDEEDGLMTMLAVIDAHSDIELDRPWGDVSCPKRDVDRAVKEMATAVQALGAGSPVDLDLSDPARDLVRSLQTDFPPSEGRVAFCILTTGRISDHGIEATADAGVHTSLWDSDRLIRTRTSGRERLVADFEPIGGLPCLIAPREAEEIQEGRPGVLITKVPGSFLGALYNKYRMRLLEQNVRAFLQFTGKVNKGIRETILQAPENFLSFNNGIAVTASKVRLAGSPERGYRIIQAEDFQIVNGGQTTASIARCVREDKADVSAIDVAMKLTVVPEHMLGELVPLISRFANSQNRIQETDFFANSPWHVELEHHSRNTEAERDELSEGHPIRWYYERVRGQYAEEIAKLSPAQRSRFRHRNPSRTRFSKTDLARYLLAWEQEAHVVSLGGQKCFGRLMTVLGATAANADTEQLPSEEDFRRICCLAILQRRGEAICRELGIVGYRANLVAYAIMLLSTKATKRMPWRRIWTAQDVPVEIDRALRVAIPACDHAIRDSAGPRNVSEWAKKDDCRKEVLARNINLDLDVTAEWDAFSIKDMARPKVERDLIRIYLKLSSNHWMRIADEVRREGRNPVWAGVAETMARRLIPSGRSPTPKQANILRKALLRYSQMSFLGDVLTNEDRIMLSGDA